MTWTWDDPGDPALDAKHEAEMDERRMYGRLGHEEVVNRMMAEFEDDMAVATRGAERRLARRAHGAYLGLLFGLAGAIQ